MIFQFLGASMPLTKTYSRDAAGILTKTSYPHAYEFTSYQEPAKDLPELLTALNKHAALGRCLLKGSLTKPLVSESRAGSTTSQDPTQWLCLDIDGLPEMVDASTGGITKQVPYNINDLLSELGVGNISYVVQWSASYGIENKKIRCHVFMLMDRPIPAPIIKQWLISLNHSVQRLRDAQSLTKTGNSLTWVLDVTACQNDKLLYIAAPNLKNIKNPMGKSPRIALVKKTFDAFTFPADFTATKNRDLTDKRILELRAIAGLPPRKLNYKVVSGNEVLIKPDVCDATEIKQERGFVYFNINGGDSWAYYHPEDNPDFIFNFKGEPTYITKDLLPEYWKSLQAAGSRQSSTGLTYLAFCDRLTGTYWKGTYDETNDNIDITPAKTLVILEHFAKQHGMVIGDYVPEWDVTFDPHDSVRVDFVNRTINTFQLTEFMKASAKKVTQCPPTILKVMHHALGSDPDITEHFVNWLAFILQNRDRTLTSWVLHGTQGTGKGILIDKIIRPIFGHNQTTVRRMEEFKQPYNAYMKQCFIVVVDEVQTKSLLDESGAMANIKNFTTERMVTIRQMHAVPFECRNYTNWIFLSNKADPIQVDREDRRTNVAKYQPEKFYPTPKDLARFPADEARIEKELQTFHDYLLSYPVDPALAATPLETEDRATLISIGENATDSVSNALLDGNMEFFVDQLPTSNKYQSNALTAQRTDDYRQVINDIMIRADALTGRVNIARDELRTIFEYTVGKIPESPNKFTSLLKHHRIHIKKVWNGAKTVNGIVVDFKDIQDFDKYLKLHFSKAVPKAKSKA